jgi:hypothetical protein
VIGNGAGEEAGGRVLGSAAVVGWIDDLWWAVVVLVVLAAVGLMRRRCPRKPVAVD